MREARPEVTQLVPVKQEGFSGVYNVVTTTTNDPFAKWAELAYLLTASEPPVLLRHDVHIIKRTKNVKRVPILRCVGIIRERSTGNPTKGLPAWMLSSNEFPFLLQTSYSGDIITHLYSASGNATVCCGKLPFGGLSCAHGKSMQILDSL